VTGRPVALARRAAEVLTTLAVGAVAAGAIAWSLSPGGGLVVGAVAVSVGAWRGRGLARELVALDRLVASSDVAGADAASVWRAVRAADAFRVTEALGRAEAADAERRAVAARMDRVADAAPNGWIVIDADDRIERTNAAARDLLGLRRDPVGLSPLEALHAAEVIDAIERARATNERTEPREFAVAERDLSVSAHPMRPGVLAIVRDVSRERALDRARTEFVANVSHELRTPIAAILGYSETLLATPGGLSGEVDLMARTIHRNGLRLRELFDDLLELYKLETRRRAPPVETVDLGELVRSAVSTARDVALARGLVFTVEAPAGLRVAASPQALSTMLLNLASNAVKYTPAGRVDVAVRVEAAEVCVDVRDTGIGIGRQHHERIFERFYRVDEGRARQIGGTGLGLAIVKHLADATGCRVSVDSDEGQGTTFTVHLPRPPERRTIRTWDVTLDDGRGGAGIVSSPERT
jgi:two-component system phosphate regulon sensor histidine kinase PhoR